MNAVGSNPTSRIVLQNKINVERKRKDMIEMECSGLSNKEKMEILKVVRKIDRKRRRDNKPRLQYRIDLEKSK